MVTYAALLGAYLIVLVIVLIIAICSMFWVELAT